MAPKKKVNRMETVKSAGKLLKGRQNQIDQTIKDQTGSRSTPRRRNG